MPQITRINLFIQTGFLSGAGTDGAVYLGVCGREFYTDSRVDDFERGASRTYVFGEGGNVVHNDVNDPRDQLLRPENVDKFPVYIRFQPKGGSDNWQLARAQLWLNDELFPNWDSALVLTEKGIWLGARSGFVLHLPKSALGPNAGDLPGGGVKAQVTVPNEKGGGV